MTVTPEDAATLEQPAPTPGGAPVWPLVVEDARRQAELRRWLHNRKHQVDMTEVGLLQDMAARDAVGRARYGTPLCVGNGRNALVDAYQEVLDAAVYLRQHLAECPTAPLWEVYEQTLHAAYTLRGALLEGAP